MSDEPNTDDVCPSCNGDMSKPDGCDECGGSGIADPIAEAKRDAWNLGPLPRAPKEERRYLGASSIPTVYEAFKPHIATLPTGEHIELPAGTVLREAPLCPRCNGTGSIETGNNDLPCDCPAGARAWFNVATKGGSRPKQGAEILADLTERVGLPREMAPSNTVREEDDMGVRFVDRSQAMIDRNKRARETWDLAHIRTGLPVPPMGSGCRVYSCWTPCAPEHHY